MGYLQFPLSSAGIGAGKSAFFIPEKFTFQQSFRDCRTVYGYKGVFLAQGYIVNGPGKLFFSCSALPPYQYGGVCDGGPYGYIDTVPELGAVTDYFLKAGSLFHGCINTACCFSGKRGAQNHPADKCIFPVKIIEPEFEGGCSSQEYGIAFGSLNIFILRFGAVVEKPFG